MICVIKAVRRIQVKQIAYCPNLYKAVISHLPHPTEFDESDEIEHQKQFSSNSALKTQVRHRLTRNTG